MTLAEAKYVLEHWQMYTNETVIYAREIVEHHQWSER